MLSFRNTKNKKKYIPTLKWLRITVQRTLTVYIVLLRPHSPSLRLAINHSFPFYR